MSKKRKSLSIRLKWRRLLLGFNGNPRATDSVLFMASQTRSAVRCLTFRKEKSLLWSLFPIYAQLTVSSGHQLVATVSWPSCTICRMWVFYLSSLDLRVFRNNSPPTRAHWCSWILVSTRPHQLITSSKVTLTFYTLFPTDPFSCRASICNWCWVGSNWSLCCYLCFSLDQI